MSSDPTSLPPETGAPALDAPSTVLRLHYVVATWFGCGFSPKAPGTVGSLGALPVFWLLSEHKSLVLNAVVISALALWGVLAGHAVALHRRDTDPGLVVIDEVVGVLIALTWVLFATWPYQALAWVLFRLFDITKPGPIRTLEHTKPIGLGIMLDDVLAGVLAGALAFVASLSGWG